MSNVIKIDQYQAITDRIIAALESGTAPWVRPWAAGAYSLPYNAATGKQYRGINLVLLGASGYATAGWMTYNQAQELGGQVRKGERGTQCVFWSKMTKKELDEDGNPVTFCVLKHFTVFNLDQIDNLPADKLHLPDPVALPDGGMLPVAIAAGATVEHGGNKAFYSPSRDIIAMPTPDNFTTEGHYNSTLAHELTHWTGLNSRMDRDFSGRFGSESYAMEELVAEMGSAFLCGMFGMPVGELQHPAYIASWLRVLRGDKKAIITAASQAQKAVDYILSESGLSVDSMRDAA